jgi:hypothetical protein
MQSKFVGHVGSKGGLEHIITTVKTEDKRDRGRQRENAEWINSGNIE